MLAFRLRQSGGRRQMSRPFSKVICFGSSASSQRISRRGISKRARPAIASKEHEFDDVDPFGHPRVPFRGHFEVGKCDLRRQWVESFTDTSLSHVGQWWEGEGNDESCSTLKLKGNIESPIGLVKIPLGIGGPLLIHGEDVCGYELLPMALTEGALVASVTRGATALTRAGGVWTVSQQQEMTRAPAFHLRTAREAILLSNWLRSNHLRLETRVREYSQHAKLLRLETKQVGRMLITRFVYETGDAGGQNMTTSVTWHACLWALEQIQKELPQVHVEDFMIESNLSGDKKMCFLNSYSPRGITAQAEAWIPESILKSVFKIDSRTMMMGHQILSAGATLGGTIMFNVNVANIMAAVFAATGQDIACVVESSSAFLQLVPYDRRSPVSSNVSRPVPDTQRSVLDVMDREGGVYAAMYLPSVLVGTVGGGTTLATQKECLEIMNCSGKGKSRRMAEIIAGFALALDLSTLSAIAGGHFATAHEKLGRNRPDSGLTDDKLNFEFFSNCLGDRGKLENWTSLKIDSRNSILSELTKSEMSKKVGHFGYVIHYKKQEDHTPAHLPVVIKSKALDSETYNLVNKMAQGCGLELATMYKKWKSLTGFKHCHEREIQLVLSEEKQLKKFMPKVYNVLRIPDKDIYAFAMEFLTDKDFRLLNTENDVSVWTEEDMKVVLDGLAEIHSVYWNREEELNALPWLDVTSGERMDQLSPLWRALLSHVGSEFPDMWTEERMATMSSAIDHIPEIWQTFDNFPQTLVHNDCNPRNICLRKGTNHTGESSGSDRLCIYDWELATKMVPQRDVAEFLLFTCPPDINFEQQMELLKYYKNQLENRTGQSWEWERFIQVHDMATLEFGMNRLLQYTMAHTYKDYQFLPRVTTAFFNYVQQRRTKGGLQFISN